VPDNVEKLNEFTIDVFCERGIQNVVLVDEQFPDFKDAMELARIQSDSDNNGQAAQETSTIEEWMDGHREWDIAESLYSHFSERQLVCDVANQIDVEAISQRISDADLVVLDLHLKGTNDTSDSIDLLKRLSQHPKFNMVVVYTNEPNIKHMMKRIAGSLIGKPNLEKQLDGANQDTIETEINDTLANLENLNCPLELFENHLFSGAKLDGAEYGQFIAKVLRNNRSLKTHKDLLHNMIGVKVVENNYQSTPENEMCRMLASYFESDNPWIVFENLFVVLTRSE